MADVESIAAEGPQHEEGPAEKDILSGEETPGITSEIETETEKDPSPKESANGIKKENVPPKRGLVKRPATSTPATGTKPIASSATRTTVGGLSKPPTRAPIATAARRPTSSTTAPTSSSASHRTQPSTGGSGDEKKKPLPAANRRTSLAPAHNSPGKTETLAEKRASGAAPSTTSRKPTTSISSSSPKQVVKPTASSSTRSSAIGSSTTSRSAPVAKPAGSSTIAEAKKRLSAIAGTPAVKPSVRTTSHATNAAPSKEIEELKAKLQDSETRVEELKKEIATSHEKLLELGIQVEDEAKRVKDAEDNVKTQHAEVLEKLHANYKADVEGLQARLEEAEKAHAAAQQSSLKAIEEAQQITTAKGASETAEALEKLKLEHTSALAALNTEFDSVKNDLQSAMTAASEKEAEITGLKSQISEANAALESIRAEQQQTLGELKNSLAKEYESALAALKAAHSEDLEKESTESSATYKKQIAELTRNHEAITSELQGKLEQATTAQAALETSHKQKYESHQTESAAVVSKLEAELATLKAQTEADSTALSRSAKEVEDLSAKIQLVEKELASAKEELADVTKTLAALQSKSAADGEALATAQIELATAKEQVATLQKNLETFDADARSKEEIHAKLTSELASTKKNLEEKVRELSVLTERHRKELETISTDYQAEIDALQGNSGIRDEYESLKIKHQELAKSLEESAAAYASEIESREVMLGELAKSHADATENHAVQLEKVKQDHAAAIVDLDNKEKEQQKLVEELKASHQKNLDEAHDRIMSAQHASQAAEIEQIQAGHSKTLAALKEQHSASQKEELEKVKATHEAVIAELIQKHSKIEATAKSDVKALKVILEIPQGYGSESNLTQDAEAALQAELSETKVSLIKAQEELNALKQDFAVEKMAKVEAQAELDSAKNKKPDTSEADALRKELQLLKDQHQASSMTAQQESAKATEEHLATKSSLEKALAELETQKATSRSDYKDMHDSLTQLAEEANKKASDLEARTKELEANLKVKDAELTEAKTKNAPLPSPNTPAKASGLAASRYAEDVGGTPELKTAEGEHDSSSAALASLAKAKVTLEQLDQMNEDLKREHERSLESISDKSKSTTFAV
ncbi:viral A-type inclusion protein repeat domain-containing protein [Diplocarpon rosae]|nr:viral A-type inclusion protein repeat domain-containing protein [Diplocarpon rosae]